jgi:negative regulator of sigma E activity
MKMQENLKELVLKVLTTDLNEEEQELLKREAVPVYSFSNGFKDSVMDRISKGSVSLVLRPDFLRSLNEIFRRVAFTGVAAIIVLIVIMFVSQGSISYDTLLGIDATIDDPLISLLVEK